MNVRVHLLACCALLTFSFIPKAAAFYATSLEPMHVTPIIPTLRNGSTSISVGATQTNGHQALTGDEKCVPFFEQYGTVKIRDLYKGLGQPTDTDTLAYKYFNAASGNALVTDADMTAAANTDATLRFNDKDNSYSSRSLNIALTQHIFTGLFVQLNAQVVEQSIRQVASVSGPNAAETDITSFMNDFEAFLTEQKLPSMSKNKRDTALERIAVMAGWSGHTDLRNSVFQQASGSISTGYVFPAPSFNHPLAPASLPYNISSGVIMRLTGHAQVAKFISADLDLSTTVYIQRRGTAHIVRDDIDATTYYAGPILLGTGYVKKDPGTLWTAHFSLGINRLASLFANVGYQFSYQEDTRLIARATDFLTGSSLIDLPAKREARLNADPRLKSWKHHALTLSAGFTPKTTDHRMIPHVHVRLAYPLLGRRSVFPSYIASGSAQLSAQWRF